jgi:hypothetical protein
MVPTVLEMLHVCSESNKNCIELSQPFLCVINTNTDSHYVIFVT